MWTIWNSLSEILCINAQTPLQLIVIAVLEFVLFICVWGFLFMLWCDAGDSRLRARAGNYMEERFSLSYYRRQEEAKTQWEEYGEAEKQTYLYRFDRLLDYSGLRERMPWATAEFFIVAQVLLVSTGFFIGIALGWGAMIGALCGIALCFILYVAIRMAADRNYEVVENGLFAFVNVMSTESKSSDDLFSILDASVPMLCPPLQKAVSRCCLEARTTGKMEESLRNLELSVENEEFRKMIRNLAMCYRTDADYAKVIRECRVGLKEHINYREEQKALLGNSRIELIELLGLGALTLYMIGNIIGEPNVVRYLGSSLVGRLVLIYIIGVMLWCVLDALLTRGQK